MRPSTLPTASSLPITSNVQQVAAVVPSSTVKMAPVVAFHTMAQPSVPHPTMSLELGDHVKDVTRAPRLLDSTCVGERSAHAR